MVLSVRGVCWVFMLVSCVALGVAMYAQLVLDLRPCVLCIYQRIPFVLALVVCGAYLCVSGWVRPAVVRLAVPGVLGALMVLNAVLGVYHTGIERAWWAETSGCQVVFPGGGDVQSVLWAITRAQAGSCTQAAWVDPVLGASMATYNAAVCVVLAVLAFWVLWRQR